jgi:predicted nucleic acid-binding protein
LRAPVEVVKSQNLLAFGYAIAKKYDRAVYDALFVALTHHLKVQGVTADEKLYKAVHADFPEIVLLRDLP